MKSITDRISEVERRVNGYSCDYERDLVINDLKWILSLYREKCHCCGCGGRS